MVHVQGVQAVSIHDSTFSESLSHTYAGAVMLEEVTGKTLVQNTTFSDNAALQGGGIFFQHVCLPLV